MEEIFIPASGMAVEDVLFSEWLKQPGDEVATGEPVAVVETDKSTVELSGTTAGRLGRHLVEAGGAGTRRHDCGVLAGGGREPSPVLRSSRTAASAVCSDRRQQRLRPGAGADRGERQPDGQDATRTAATG